MTPKSSLAQKLPCSKGLTDLALIFGGNLNMALNQKTRIISCTTIRAIIDLLKLILQEEIDLQIEKWSDSRRFFINLEVCETLQKFCFVKTSD